jgi:hypothetical protein
LLVLLLACLVPPLAAQGTARLTQETRLYKAPRGTPLGTLAAGASVTPQRTTGDLAEVSLEGWIASAGLGPINRDGFTVATRKAGTELREKPDGPVVARLNAVVGFVRSDSQGSWTRVQRTAWIARKALQSPSALAAPATPGTDQAAVGRRAALSLTPGGASVGQVDSGLNARVLARAGGWTRVQFEAWVPDSALDRSTEGVLVGVSRAEVRSNPARFVGQVLEWRLQFVAVQTADELRPEIPGGQSYLLMRGPLPEPGFVYVTFPAGQLATWSALPALREVTVRGTLRSATTKYLPIPVLDLVSVVSGLGS